jgi:hypothetical protein
MEQGFANDQFVGDSVFSKYISMKVNFRWPHDEYAIHNQYRVQLIHGWTTAPLAYPSTTINDYTPERGSVTFDEINGTLNALVLPAFNQSTDVMTFREKEKPLYKIEGKQWIKPNRSNQIGHPQSTAILVDGLAVEDYQTGGPPDVFKQLHWKPMRKIRLQRTSNGPEPSNTEFHYPNESWIPFVAVYTPDYGNIVNNDQTGNPPTEEYFPRVQYSSCHWYTDS